MGKAWKGYRGRPSSSQEWFAPHLYSYLDKDMAAAKGNNYNMKYKTTEEQKQLLENYIAHVEQGLSDSCFPDVDMQTFKVYCEKFPEVFETDRIAAAKRKRKLFWEKMGADGSLGELDKFNATSWKFNMQNRFGWRDKRDYDYKDKTEKSDEERSKILTEQINEHKKKEGSNRNPNSQDQEEQSSPQEGQEVASDEN